MTSDWNIESGKRVKQNADTTEKTKDIAVNLSRFLFGFTVGTCSAAIERSESEAQAWIKRMERTYNVIS